MIQKYRKKPVIISAIYWDGTEKSLEAIKIFCGKALRGKVRGTDKLRIATIEGEHIVRTQSYIIRGVAGEYYGCVESVFNRTYERA